MTMNLVIQDATGPRNAAGAFISRDCRDPNCGGQLQFDGQDWVCDGLTYRREDGPLEACTASAPVFK